MPFESPDVALKDLLEQVGVGKLQLPDFQREWKWDNDRIVSLLASLSLDYPIGVLMSLQMGGDSVRFQPRAISGTDAAHLEEPEELLLDGQQRVTSLFQALKSGRPTETHDAKQKKLKRWYYIDIDCALDPDRDHEEAIVSVPEDRRLMRDFGRTMVADYSTLDLECEAEMFPLMRVFDMGSVFDWQNRYIQLVNPESETAPERWQRFYAAVLENIVRYEVPVIVLTRDTPKEAVCTVFEKVNTGGVVLNVFELLTATFAADDFRLNDDWRDRQKHLAAKPALDSLESTDFLQALTLVSTYRRREAAQERGETAAVSCRRKDILNLELEDYQDAADAVAEGFEWAAEFLSRERIFRSRDVPYRTQMVPLAALRVIVGPNIDNHDKASKVRRWFWCGVLGELYGGATETRFARDIELVPAWLDGGASPRTVDDASFEASRLETLRTRNSAAYKGLYALVMREGARDWIKNRQIDMAAFFDLAIDIHHIFPRKWCDDNGIAPGQRDSIVNKTPLSWDTNRSIGGRPPSSYIKTIQDRVDLSDDQLNELLTEHLVDGNAMREDDFSAFYESRKNRLIAMIAEATGKDVRRDDLAPDEDTQYEPDGELLDVAEEIAATLSEEDLPVEADT